MHQPQTRALGKGAKPKERTGFLMPRWIGWTLVVASAYVLCAKLGFSLAFGVRQVTAVWPPAGVAVAAVLLGGYRMWFGVWLGAFVSNAMLGNGEPLFTAAGIATGNTLGPLLGNYLLRRCRFHRAFARVRDVFAFVVFGSMLSMVVTATNGVAQLGLAHLIAWSSYASVWLLWWTGDAMGALLVAPLILTWSDVRREGVVRGEAGTFELAIFSIGACATAILEFFSKLPLAFPLYPFVVWSALRIGARVTAAAIVAICSLAIWGTVHGLGPFQSGNFDQRLMALVTFTSVLSITGLVLSAITSERRSALTKMQAAERRFQVLAQTVPQIVWTADPGGRIDWFNQRWRQYTGRDDFSPPTPDWAGLIEAGEPFEREVSLRREDGVSRWFLIRAEPMRDDRGKIVRWYGTHTDIDDQRRAVERSARIAKTLQSAFLPESLPKHPELRLDALYLTAGSEALIGGDWYDAMSLPDRRILISIGDVTGHGLTAAVTAGRIRQSIVATAIDVPDPAAILTKVNRLLQLRDTEVATALVALVDVDSMTMHFASAGHPPPIIGGPNLKAHALAYGSLPLGVATSTEYHRQRVAFERDMVVLFYTDGITEFQRNIEAAELALCSALDDLAAAPPVAHPADAIRRAVIADEKPSDDAVLMVMHVAPSSTAAETLDNIDLHKSWSFHSSHAYSAHSARHEVMSYIQRFARANEDLFTAELILGEILANTVEHAPGLVNMEIDWTDSSPVVTVLDTGPGLERFTAQLPDDALTEDGRGLFLVKTLARDVRVESDQGYGTKMTVVLPIAR
jgi:serine phosphatase RsbU (regulator of sigma subunit)/integral membrane sensor domain MASE1/anti-sigma regulatory factor (Ser/Thr protein kinase)